MREWIFATSWAGDFWKFICSVWTDTGYRHIGVGVTPLDALNSAVKGALKWECADQAPIKEVSDDTSTT